ncbi:MAG: hypothetical protein BGO26_02990 [Actinobacteria bacterium 69-20]|jgi:hypothetical protein|nr:DUF1801 domain-containing protein [Actinomycetota bacterium]OJV30958.1 MAG: hypothetical protein BGO26_02990 [Actinobacteria bacterium 69-20]
MTGSPLDSYLAAAERPWPHTALKAIITAIRAGAAFDEAIEWGQPYFSRSGHAVVKLHAARDWINLFYYRGAELPDPGGLLVGEGSSGMRRQRVHRGDPDLPLAEIQRLVRTAAILAGD